MISTLRLSLFAMLTAFTSSVAAAQDPRNNPKSSDYVDWGNQAIKVEERQSVGIREATHANNEKTGYPVNYWTRGILRPFAGPALRPWLLYDAIDERLYTRSASDKLETVSTITLREFSVGDSLLGSRRTYRRYLDARVDDATLRTAFFEVHYDAGRSALLCRRVTYIDPGNLTSVRRGLKPPKRIVEKKTYYLKRAENNTLIPVALNADVILGALGTTHRAELAAYVSQKRLKLTQENDVIALLAYADTL